MTAPDSAQWSAWISCATFGTPRPVTNVVAWAGIEGAVAASCDVAETRGAKERIQLRVEEAQRRLAGLLSRFVDQCANPAQTGALQLVPPI